MKNTLRAIGEVAKERVTVAAERMVPSLPEADFLQSRMEMAAESGFSEDDYDRAMQVGLRLASITYEEGMLGGNGKAEDAKCRGQELS